MVMYFSYLKERQNIDSLVIPDIGFATYSIEGDQIKYILVYDFYIKKEERRTGRGTELVQELHRIAAENGCKFAAAQIDKESRGWKEALIFQQKCGMIVEREDNHTIYLRKEL